jgi:hypothetical protein
MRCAQPRGAKACGAALSRRTRAVSRRCEERSTFLAAFEIAASDDVEQQTNAIEQAALFYSTAHHMATKFAFAGRPAPLKANFEAWPAH